MEHRGAFIFLNYSFVCTYGPGVELINHMVILFLVFQGTSILFSTMAAPASTLKGKFYSLSIIS